MGLLSISTSPADYVVLDVETNGLKSKEDDLLSVSIYKPDDGREYNRFLPLDLNRDVYTTDINGITKCDLKGKTHLVQEDVDELFSAFELDRRTILHYGGLDERFIRDYFARRNLAGYERMHFFNFKRMICSTKFSDGSLSKDRLCEAFGIEGVSSVHTGMNDCKLEWQLFKALDGRYLLATMRAFNWQFSALDPGYIVPVSYLNTFPNLSRLYERPYISFEPKEVYRLNVSGDDIRRFETNFSGVTVERLIDVMLGVKTQDNLDFLRENYRKNKPIGRMKHDTRPVFMTFNPDGTVTAKRDEDKQRERELNATLGAMRGQIAPLVEFIRSTIFCGKEIVAQELTVNEEMRIMALCDLSTDDAVLEIKTSARHPEQYAEQLFYEARGRKTYLMTMDWRFGEVDFVISEVAVVPGEKPDKRREKAVRTLSTALEGEEIEVAAYDSSTSPVKVRCKECGHEWEETYPRIKAGKCVCPVCHPDRVSARRTRRATGTPRPPREKMTPEQALAKRAQRYAGKVSDRSGGALAVDATSYIGGRDPVKVCCSKCGYTWMPRTDHLLARPFCPKCGAGRQDVLR